MRVSPACLGPNNKEIANPKNSPGLWPRACQIPQSPILPNLMKFRSSESSELPIFRYELPIFRTFESYNPLIFARARPALGDLPPNRTHPVSRRGPFWAPRAAKQLRPSISGRLLGRSENDQKNIIFQDPPKSTKSGPMLLLYKD